MTTYDTETGLVCYVVPLSQLDDVIATMNKQAERLQAENERIRKYWKATGEGVNKYVGKSFELEDKITALKAENERLRKAGDALDAYIKRQDGTTNGMLDCRNEWAKAKGVQS